MTADGTSPGTPQPAADSPTSVTPTSGSPAAGSLSADLVDPAPDGGPWAAVVGQPDAVHRLRAAVASPVHAYLLQGPPGSGRRAAARAFVGELLASANPADDPGRHRRLAAEEQHPALFVVERVGPSITADQAREVVRRSSLSPPEGELQVIVVVDVHLALVAGPILLKAVEEPPQSTVFVLLAEELPPELDTIGSRCVRVDFGPVPPDAVAGALVADGLDQETARAAAEGAGGDLHRARLLAADSDYAARRDSWWSVPDRLDGSGAAVAAVVDELLEQIAAARQPLEARQATELADLRDQLQRTGASGAGELDRMDKRHKRERRRLETDEVKGGLGVLARRYRNDVELPGGDRRFVGASTAIGDTIDRLVFNPRVDLQLQSLFVRLARLARVR